MEDIEFNPMTGEVINNDSEFKTLVDSLTCDVNDKLDGIEKIKKNLNTSIDGIDAEIKRLQARISLQILET